MRIERATALMLGGAIACASGAAADARAPEESAAIRISGATLALDVVTGLAALPSVAAEDTLLDADAPVAGDHLLPSIARARLGQLVEHFTPEDSLRSLRVVCTRFVPCAPSVADPTGACVGQVRFVFQPVSTDAMGQPFAQDAAVHVFYELGSGVMHGVAEKLRALPGAHDAVPFGVQRASLGDTRRIALEAAASGTFARMTFVRNVDVKGNTWDMGGVDVRNGALVELGIPRVGTVMQRVVLNGSFPFGVSMSPAPADGPQLGLLLDPVRFALLLERDASSARTRIADAYGGAKALEDPREHDTRDTDCVSCHVAGLARRVAEDAVREHQLMPLDPPTPVVEGGAIASEPTGTRPAESLRACGYVGRAPVLSARLVNESTVAAVRMGEL